MSGEVSRLRANGRTRLPYGDAWMGTPLRKQLSPWGHRSGFDRLAACLAPSGRSLNSLTGTCLRVGLLYSMNYIRHPRGVKEGSGDQYGFSKS